MINQTQQETIELTIEEAKKDIDKLDALDRLYTHPDFKLLISEGLCEEEAIRLVRAGSFPGNKTEERQATIQARIAMIGELQMYFQQIRNSGNAAMSAMAEHELTLQEIIEEGEM